MATSETASEKGFDIRKFGLLAIDALVCVLLVALAVYITRGIWAGQFVGGTDFMGHIYKARFLADSWRSGGPLFPLWSSTWYAGYPFLQVYSPLSYILTAIVTLMAGNDIVASKIVVVGSYLFSGIAMYYAARYIFKSRVAGFLAAMSFLLFPYRTAHTMAGGNLPFCVAIAFAPLMVSGYIALTKKFTYRRAIWFSVPAALVLLSHLNTFAFFGVLIASYSGWLVLFPQNKISRFRQFLLEIKDLFSYALFVFLWTAWWFLPLFLVSRATLPTEYNPYIIQLSSFPYFSLFITRENIIFGGTYVGAVVLVVVLLALITRRFKINSDAVFFLFVAIISVVMSTAYAVPFLGVLANALPFGGLFVPVRFFYVASAAVPLVLGAAGGALFSALKRLGPRWVGTTVAFAALAVIAAMLYVDYLPVESNFGLKFAPSRSYLDAHKKILYDGNRFVRFFETGASWYSHPYAPVWSEHESLDGWYIEGTSQRDTLAVMNSILFEKLDPSAFAPLMRTLSTGYFLTLSDQEDKVEFFNKAEGLRRTYKNREYSLYELEEMPEPARTRPAILMLVKKEARQNILVDQLLGGGEFAMAPGDYRVLDEIQRYQEIKNYDAIFLWGYNYQANPPDNSLLTEYVENGGTLIICPDGSPDAKQDETKNLFDVSIKTGKSAGRVDWKPVGIKGRKVAKDIDFELFADASWTGLPWSYSYFEGATPLVTANGRTVLGETPVGRGRVLWMGYNLPYFAAYKKSVPASTLFCNLIEYGLGKTGDADIVFFDKTEYGSISVRAITKSAKPVWLEVSESFYPGWTATVNGTAVDVSAGQPAVMLVNLSGSTDYRIELKYKPTAAHYVGWACTIIFILLLAAWYSSAAFRSYAESILSRVDL